MLKNASIKISLPSPQMSIKQSEMVELLHWSSTANTFSDHSYECAVSFKLDCHRLPLLPLIQNCGHVNLLTNIMSVLKLWSKKTTNILYLAYEIRESIVKAKEEEGFDQFEHSQFCLFAFRARVYVAFILISQ